MNALTIIAIVSQVLPLIVKAIEFAEQAYAGQTGKSEVKKDMVMQFAGAVFAVLGYMPQWEAAKPQIGVIVDSLVALMKVAAEAGETRK